MCPSMFRYLNHARPPEKREYVRTRIWLDVFGELGGLGAAEYRIVFIVATGLTGILRVWFFPSSLFSLLGIGEIRRQGRASVIGYMVGIGELESYERDVGRERNAEKMRWEKGKKKN